MKIEQIKEQRGVTTTYWNYLEMIPTTNDALILLGSNDKENRRITFELGIPFIATRVCKYTEHSSFGNDWEFNFAGYRFYYVYKDYIQPV